VISGLNRALQRAIEVFNRYRSPEATAKLVEVSGDEFVIEFEGPFCMNCGVQDHFEDFIVELEDINQAFRAEMVESEPSGSQSFRVRYRLRGGSSVEDFEEFREFLQEQGMTLKDYLSANPCTKDVLMFNFRTWLFEKKQATKQ